VVRIGVNVPHFGPGTDPGRLPGQERIAGEGTIDQVLSDLDELRLLGAEAVVLDPFVGDPAETERPETAWQALATIAAHRGLEKQ
jgi:hypothetical protein